MISGLSNYRKEKKMDDYLSKSPYQIFHQVIGLHHYRSHQLLENKGVYRGQPPLLFALHKKDGQSQKELSKELGVQPATITVMVKRMAKAGLIERKQDKEDQRISRVYLTREGERIRKQAVIITRQIEEECFGSLSEEENDTLKKLLFKVKENILSNCGDNCTHVCLKKEVTHE